MTTDRNKSIERRDKYSLAALAVTRLEDPLERGAALEEQIKSFGWNAEEAEGVLAGALTSEEGIKTALENYTEKYQEGLYETKVGDLFADYDTVLQEDLGKDSGEYERAMAIREAHKDKNYGDIAKAVMKAQAQVKNRKTLELSDDEFDSAKDTLEKYKNLFNLITTVERDRLEGLRRKVTKRNRKNTLKEILKE